MRTQSETQAYSKSPPTPDCCLMLILRPVYKTQISTPIFFQVLDGLMAHRAMREIQLPNQWEALAISSPTTGESIALWTQV